MPPVSCCSASSFGWELGCSSGSTGALWAFRAIICVVVYLSGFPGINLAPACILLASGRRYGDMHTAAAQWRFVHGAGALGATYVPGPAAHPSGFLSTNLAPASILLAQAAAVAICTQPRLSGDSCTGSGERCAVYGERCAGTGRDHRAMAERSGGGDRRDAVAQLPEAGRRLSPRLSRQHRQLD